MHVDDKEHLHTLHSNVTVYNSTNATKIRNSNKNLFNLFLEISEFGGALTSVALMFYLIGLVLKLCVRKSVETKKYINRFELLTYTLLWYAVSVSFGLYNKLVFSKTSC